MDITNIDNKGKLDKHTAPIVQVMTIPREESCLGMIDARFRKYATIVSVDATHKEWRVKYINNKN